MLSFAQAPAKFKVGDRVKIPDHDSPATIVKAAGGWLTVKYDDVDGNYEVMSSGNIVSLDANSNPIVGKKDTPTKQTEMARDNKKAEAGAKGVFKVGDRVKVNHAGLQGDEFLKFCTITGGLKDNSYQVRCDPWKTFSYMDYGVLPEWVHPWPGATAAPRLECSFDAPTGTVSKTSGPSAQLFQRVIYERMADDVKAQHGAKVRFGLQFTTFQIGTPFKNEMTGRGLLKNSAPQNAMFYPVKTQFKECREVVNGDYNRFRVTKMNFGCYKDRFGDWVCGTDSTPAFSDEQDVPKKQ